ncbi:MAG: hypothetical protein HYV90_03510 [Candidatus Woesebacteria bacterium]|nr:MAG: hypothetical protein HYV90_03510 [Candidatus Woesebacteria bacterium]
MNLPIVCGGMAFNALKNNIGRPFFYRMNSDWTGVQQEKGEHALISKPKLETLHGYPLNLEMIIGLAVLRLDINSSN